MKRDDAGEASRREQERLDLVRLARIEAKGQRFPAVLVNLSEAGFAYSSFIHLSVGDEVCLVIAPDIRFDAVVIWESGIRTGCRFVATVTPDALQSIGGVL